MNQKFAKTKLVLKYVFLVTPIIAYVILFSQHSKVQKYFGLKCKNNFIVTLDGLIFGQYGYNLIDASQHWSLDILSGCMYLIHYPLPILYLIYLAIHKNEIKNCLIFLLAFGVVNCAGVIFQYMFPTPPPWMLANLAPEAKFHNFDKIFHTNLFKNIYSQSPLVCGAWPSLHMAWPSIIFSLRPWFGKTFSLLHVLLIGFSAVYSSHHYFIDVLFGFVLAFVLTNMCANVIDKYFDIEKEFRFIFDEMLNNSTFLKLNSHLNITQKRNKSRAYDIIKINLKCAENVQLV
jgi:membrane-associated phospholipid phosphatase